MSNITEIAMYAPCKVKSTRSGKEYNVSKIDYTQNLVSCSNGKTTIWLYPADLEIIDSERKCYPKQDVDEMMQYFQYSVHTIKQLNDKLRAVGHTGFEITHTELQQKINSFTSKHNPDDTNS